MPSESGVLIRELRKQDIAAIAAWMVTDPHWSRYGMTVTSITTDLQHALEHRDIALVAEVYGQPAGFAWCVERGMFGADAYLKRIGVDPALTGRSIGSMLIDAVEHVARDHGASHLSLLVGGENLRAERFYVQRGYEFAGALPSFAIGGVEERVYRKRLVPLSYSDQV